MTNSVNPPENYADYQNAIDQVIKQFPGKFSTPRVELVSPFPESQAFDIMVVVQMAEDGEESERDQIRDQVQPAFAKHGIALPEPEERADGKIRGRGGVLLRTQGRQPACVTPLRVNRPKEHRPQPREYTRLARGPRSRS